MIYGCGSADRGAPEMIRPADSISRQASEKSVLPVLSTGMAARSGTVVCATLPRHGKLVQFQPASTLQRSGDAQ